MECFFDTHIAVYFADQAIPNSKDDALGNDSTLFGDILHIPRVGTCLLDIALRDVMPEDFYRGLQISFLHVNCVTV